MESVSDSSAASRRARRQRKLDHIEISEDEVSISEEIPGKGGFGAVYIGDYLGRNVACKVRAKGVGGRSSLQFSRSTSIVSYRLYQTTVVFKMRTQVVWFLNVPSGLDAIEQKIFSCLPFSPALSQSFDFR